jgi:hypothetical protein
LNSITSITAGLSVDARRNSFASRLRNCAAVVTSSSQYVRMIQGTSRHTCVGEKKEKKKHRERLTRFGVRGQRRVSDDRL